MLAYLDNSLTLMAWEKIIYLAEGLFIVAEFFSIQ